MDQSEERFLAMDDGVATRAIHVLAIVFWIGGVAMLTTHLPSLRRFTWAEDRVAFFELVERRFARRPFPDAGY
jgi:uncharacterized membrane protein